MILKKQDIKECINLFSGDFREIFFEKSKSFHFSSLN
jgi:hypothetical protein